MRKNKGITLIALIITIIILLILVGVSVNILIKSNLIGTAEKTVNKYKTASEEENEGNITIEGKEYDNIDDYFKKDSHDWQYIDNTRAQIRCTCARCKAFDDGDSTGRTLSIGQQIGKTETKTASTSITSEKSGYLDQTLELNKEETKWVVFGYEDKDNDGLNEVLLLTTEHPTQNTIFLNGAAGYNNAMEEVNRMCKELYGTNARSMTIEDVNRVLGYTPAGGMYYLNDAYNTTGNFTTKLKNLGDVWTSIKNEIDTKYSGKYYDPSHPEGIRDGGEASGEYELNGYFYVVNSTAGASTEAPQVSSEISITAKKMIFGSDYNNYGYWLASRGVYAESDDVSFGPGIVYYGNAKSYTSLVYSHGYLYLDYFFCLRPIVTLTSNIPEAGEILEFSGQFTGGLLPAG